VAAGWFGTRGPLLRVVAAVAAMALMTACGAGGSGAGPDDSGGGQTAAEPYRVVYISGQTGPLATPAKAVGRGLQAHVDELNKKGGINGRPIELIVKDSQSDPSRSVTLLQEQLNDGPVDLVVPGTGSNEGLAMAPVLERRKVVGLGVAASPVLDDVKKYPYYFSVNALQSDILVAVVEFLKNRGDVERVAVVTADDALGDAVTAGFKAAAGSDLSVTEVRFKSDSVDLTATFQQAMDADPDWIFMEGSGAQIGHMLEGRIKAGAEKVPTVAGGAATGQVNLLQIAKEGQLESVHGVLMPVQAYVDPADRGEQFTTMLERIKAQGPLETSLFTYALAWDIIGIWSAAVTAAGDSPDGPALKTALENLKLPEDPQFPIMRNTFSADRHFPRLEPEHFTVGRFTDFVDGMYVTDTAG